MPVNHSIASIYQSSGCGASRWSCEFALLGHIVSGVLAPVLAKANFARSCQFTRVLEKHRRILGSRFGLRKEKGAKVISNARAHGSGPSQRPITVPLPVQYRSGSLCVSTNLYNMMLSASVSCGRARIQCHNYVRGTGCNVSFR